MVRIKIGDLPEKKISREEMVRIMGGTFFISPFPFDFHGSLQGAYVTYESSTEGAGHLENMDGLHATRQDAAKDKWNSDD